MHLVMLRRSVYFDAGPQDGMNTGIKKMTQGTNTHPSLTDVTQLEFEARRLRAEFLRAQTAKIWAALVAAFRTQHQAGATGQKPA
ncbi:MAG: hypothetical protein JJT99_00795 [Rhodobacteraceae bacterium]|nr:hypothetical protein [Paracoccaceae bacterium]